MEFSETIDGEFIESSILFNDGSIRYHTMVEEDTENHQGPMKERCVTNEVNVEVCAVNCDSPVERTCVVDEKVEPCVGMKFDNEDDAFKFYKQYSTHMGFSIRKNRTYKSKKLNITIYREYVCSKEGTCGEGKSQIRPSQREGCPAKFIIKRREDDKWYLAKLVTCHNHTLVTPSKVYLLGSQKDISEKKKCLLDSFNRIGMRTRDCVNYIAQHSGGFNNIGFTEKIARNYMGKGKLKNNGIDSHILEYFKSMQAKNSGFFYAIQVDADEHLSNVFWVDAKSRHAYQHFGDVVSFDTTYKKNRYLMPFAPFVGVNHHRQTVLFGCALLSDETEDTFVWLFQTWLEAMYGCHPQSILTDQDKAMRVAIQRVFPNTTHCFCKWHICKKLPEKISHIFHKHKNFSNEFHKCIEMNNTDEFELAWEKLLEKYGLDQNEWMKSLYVDRKHWIPSYVKNIFCAGMSTTGRSESINKFFKDYVHAKTTLAEFVKQYERALDKRYDAEVQADFFEVKTKPILKLNADIEKQAAEIYTRSIFEIFQQQYIESTQCPVRYIGEDGTIKTYHVQKFCEEKMYVITFNFVEIQASCSCKMFEFEGILCKHILAVFRENHIFWLPNHYILKRWRKDCKKQDLSDMPKVQVQAKRQESDAMMYNMICVEAMKIADEWAINASTLELMLSIIHRARREVIALNESATVHQGSPPIHENEDENSLKEGTKNNTMSQITLRNPLLAATKGRRPNNKRMKSPLEDTAKKKRTCGFCGQKGHNNRTCKTNEQAEEVLMQE